jgi:hypothetical protein
MPEKPGLSNPRGLVSTAVTGAEEMEVERAWDDRTFGVGRRKSGLAAAVVVAVVVGGGGG